MKSKLFIGTSKGLFTYENLNNPKPKVNFEGQSIYAIGIQKERIWASPFSEWMGTSIVYSDNYGNDWEQIDPITFPKSSDSSIKKIWQISSIGDKLLFGVEPAALFITDKNGQNGQVCEGLWNHPHRENWEPGFGGLCLHTILPLSEDKWVVAISTGGVYRTEDAGKTWSASNQSIETPFLQGDEIPEFGQCVHKIAHHPDKANEMFLQHHWGVYHSTDSGETWNNISKDKALPSDFGFACVSNKVGTAFIIPVTSDKFRCFPDGKLTVYRTEDSGKNWQGLTNGLPQNNAYDSVLRDSFDCIDNLLVFGTTGGSIFVSDDNGNSWKNIANHLPRITCVKIAK